MANEVRQFEVIAYDEHGNEADYKYFKTKKQAFKYATELKNENEYLVVYVQQNDGEEIINDWCINEI